jgi:multicomponent Na+:H+ antiporter subunit F
MILYILMTALTILTLTSAFVILRGPTAHDRLQGFSLLSSKLTALMVLYYLYSDQSFALDMAIIYSMIGFISLTLIARYISGGGEP